MGVITPAEVFALDARCETILRLRKKLAEQPIPNPRLDARYVLELLQIKTQLQAFIDATRQPSVVLRPCE